MANENNSKVEAMTPQGYYQARAVADSYVVGKAGTGVAQIGVSLQITDGPYKNKTFPWIGTVKSGEPLRITLDAMEAMGVTHFVDDDLEKAGGRGKTECSIFVEHREQMQTVEGQTVAVMNPDGTPKLIPQIKYVNKLGGEVRMKEKLEGDELETVKLEVMGALAERRLKNQKKGGVPLDENGQPKF